jgi:hypothetical protein
LTCATKLTVSQNSNPNAVVRTIVRTFCHPVRLSACSYYSASVPTIQHHSSGIHERLSSYIDRLLVGVADRIAERVADRLATDYKAQLEAVEVLRDDEAVEDLRRASQEPDEDAQPYEDVRRELGLA